MSAYNSFVKCTGKKYLYNITAINNIPSILCNGILCYNIMEEHAHLSIAIKGVQDRRAKVKVLGERSLHEYANLYFTYNNPMLYYNKAIADDICILVFSAQVLDIAECVISDRNASTNLVRFYDAENGVSKLDFEKIFSQYWTHENKYEQKNHKAIKCAEVLVPNVIPCTYLLGAIAASDEAKEHIEKQGFTKKIIVEPKAFYR